MEPVKSELKVGDDVSYCFNGDCYPDGKVERITKSGKYLYTSNGNKYVKHVYQRWTPGGMDGDGSRYVPAEGYNSIGGTWALVKGVHNERNPEF